jgi:hypothetical protein
LYDKEKIQYDKHNIFSKILYDLHNLSDHNPLSIMIHLQTTISIHEKIVINPEPQFYIKLPKNNNNFSINFNCSIPNKNKK